MFVLSAAVAKELVTSYPSGRAKEPARSVQRWRARHYHNDHGAGLESAAGRRTGGVEAVAAGVSELRAELHLSWHLLEQSSSPPAHDQTGQRRHSLGESAPAVLAITVSVCDGVDRGEPCCADANRLVRMRAVDGSHCVLHFATDDH